MIMMCQTINRRGLIFILMWISTLAVSYGQRSMDMGRAMDYCRGRELRAVEGIWEFPDDETRVLIRVNGYNTHRYDVILITSPDCRLNPGEKIGELEASPEKGKMKLSLFAARKDGILSDSRNCMAEFRDADDAILIHPRKIDISLVRRATSLLPKFWKLLGTVSVDNPVGDLCRGLIRVYPRRSQSEPVYL